jgi:hypothetical protein
MSSRMTGNHTPPLLQLQVWPCVSVLTFSCVPGSTLPRRPLGEFANATSRQSFAKISPFLTTLAPVRSLPAYRQIPVGDPFNFRLTSGYRCWMHADLVHQGISEKVPLVVSSTASFFTGFILAFLSNWRLALATSSIFPWMAISGALMNKFAFKYSQYVSLPQDFYELGTHSSSGSHSNMLPKAERSQRKSYLPSVPCRLSALRMCLPPCMTLRSRRPTTWIADLQSPRASVFLVYSLRVMRPMASVSP